MAKPKLSIIIPVKQTKADNRGSTRLDECLKSLDAQTVAGQFEVIVSDTDSSPSFQKDHAATAKAHKAKYVFTKTGQAWNISRTRNIGIRSARADFVMVTDADCVFDTTFIETVLRHMAEGVIVHCRIIDLPETFGGPLNDWARMKGLGAMRPNWCYGGCQVVSRKWAESVHGYDEKFELWGAEDADFMERAVQAGKKSVWIEGETSYFHQWHDQSNRTADVLQKSKNRERLKLTEGRLLPIVRNPRRWGGQSEAGEWDDTAIIITTFLRDTSLLRTIQSIRKFYPLIDIIIADNGHPDAAKSMWSDTYDCRIVEVPFDSGVTVARNAGVQALEKRHKYAVIVEDDIGFTADTDLLKWRAILDHEPTVGVAGGRLRVVNDYGEEYYQAYEATLEINEAERTAYLRKIENPEWLTYQDIRYHFADIVLNIFMARREVLDAHPWDEQIKSAPEHCDWFFGLKYRTPELKSRGVVFVPDVILRHFRDMAGIYDSNYRAYRNRPGAFAYFGKKWGVDHYWNSWNPKWGVENPQVLGTYAELSTHTRKNVFTSAARILDFMGVKWWLEAGTCLGAIREKDFIGHDPDMDIGIWADDVRGVAADLMERMKAADFALVHELEHSGQLFELSFTKADVKLDVFFFFERNGLAWHGAFGPENENGIGEYNVFLPHVFSLGLFKDLKDIEFAGLRVKVPNPPEQYLTERYGSDWRTPDKDYHYWTDCRAVARKFFDADTTVYIGGVWDVFHHGHLNILERCKALGARLIVGVLTDDAAAAYKARPLIPQEERLRIIRAIRCVDEAILQHDQDPTRDLAEAGIKLDYLVHGDDWDNVPGSDYVWANGGRTIFFPYTTGISSTIIKLGGDIVRLPRKVSTGGAEYAIGIKTFLREKTLFRTIQAFQKNLDVPFRLYICDDSGKRTDRKLALYQDLRKRGACIIDKPFDSGLSAGRNAIIHEVKEAFILITDDDVALDNQDALDRMRAVLDARTDIGLVAALIKYENGGAFANDNYVRGLRLERVGGMLKRTPARGEYKKAPMRDGGEALYLEADQVPNCFLCRAETFADLKFDERIKVEFEHMDLALQIQKAGRWCCAVAVEAMATHYRSEPDLIYERHRRSAPAAYFMQKWSISSVINQF